MSAVNTKVAIVTGANKGIGYAIVKGLCQRFNGKVYLTARNVDRGKEAERKLKDLGLDPSFHQLDVNNQGSVDKFEKYVNATYGGVDLLINNAGVRRGNKPTATDYEIAENIINTNYFGLLRVTEAFLPLLRKDARIVNVSSTMGLLSRIPSQDLRAKLSAYSLTVSKLNDLLKQYLKHFKDNLAAEKGWGNSTYIVSKVCLCALTRVHQKFVDEKYPDKNISINSVHPGFVSTDMTYYKDGLTAEQGAKSALFAALDAENIKGQLIGKDTEVIDWTTAPFKD